MSPFEPKKPKYQFVPSKGQSSETKQLPSAFERAMKFKQLSQGLSQAPGTLIQQLGGLMESPPRYSQFLLFLGAGAPKSAGIPTMIEFVSEFTNHIENSQLDSDCKKLLRTITDSSKRFGTPDIELVLKTLNEFTTLDKSVVEATISSFTAHGRLSSDIEKIVNHSTILLPTLKEFIKNRCSQFDGTNVTKYYSYLFDELFKIDNLIDVFTTNWDATVEYYCVQKGIKIKDGIEDIRFKRNQWRPSTLDDIPRNVHEKMVRLHKLHGSISWYLDKEENIHWSDSPGTTELTTWGKVENLILYPLDEKSILREPFLELFLRFRSATMTPRFIIVVGYSFRDEHIRQLIEESVSKKWGTFLVIIDPNATQLRNNYFNNTIYSGLIHLINVGIDSSEFPNIFRNFTDSMSTAIKKIGGG